MRSRLLLFLLLTATAWAEPTNLAPTAKVSTSTQRDAAHAGTGVADGIIGVADKGEWACVKATTSWGYIRYPWVQLDWDQERSVSKVVLYDRPSLAEHTAGGRLLFSDGSAVSVTAIPNDGTARVVTFAPRSTRWVRFEVTDGDGGGELGLSEIEVYPAPSDYTDAVSWVNTFIETTRGRYLYFATGSLPFGMVAAAPHTRNKNQWGGGYNYNSLEILGFGQIHDWSLSGVEVMPTTGGVDPTLGQAGWKSSFNHDDEIAEPGYHRVFLRDFHTWVELTSTERVAFYRFRFTRDAVADILVNLGGYLGEATMTGCQVRRSGPAEIEGSFVSTGRYWGGPNKVRIFFVMAFDRSFEALNGWSDKERIPNATEVKGSTALTRRQSDTYAGETFSFWDSPTAGVAPRYTVKAGDELRMKVAISYTSVENARQNLQAEGAHWDFDKVRAEARAQWNRWLSKIEVEGGTEAQKIKLYTDLWHALLGRHKIDDVSGSYPDYTGDKREGKFSDGPLVVRTLTKGRHMYSSDALWLTQWNLNVLWGLAWPSVLDDFSSSMLQYADNGGLLPRGPCAGGYTYIMTGCPATNMIVSAFMKGMLTKADPKHAFEVMKRNHMPGGMMGQFAGDGALEFYIEHGYCPGNAGITLEWAFQDWSLGQMAQKLGLKEDAAYFDKRSHGWKALFRPDQGLIFPKDRDGKWLHDDPLSNQGWVEANAWQATWSVSHDIAALAGLMGGEEKLCAKLDHAFRQSVKDDFVFGYGSGYVSYANQPGCSNAHVFNLAGQPWLSQYWVRQVKEKAYGGITPDQGYGGHDEDQGQMGGVSALMSLGLFSLQGNDSVTPVYELTGPIFDQVTIHLDPAYYKGKTFVIKTHDNGADRPYIRAAKLNGVPLETCFLSHQDYAQGGVLELWMDSKPNKNWGTKRDVSAGSGYPQSGSSQQRP